MEAASLNVAAAVKVVAPEAMMILAACGFMMAAAFSKGRKKAVGFDGWLLASLATILVAFLSAGFAAESLPKSLASSPFRPDAVAHFVRLVALSGGLVLALVAGPTFPVAFGGECYACLLLIVAGTSLVGFANDLVTLFLALELISVPTYLLLYLNAKGASSQEATIKYFLLSVFSSGFFLFGASYLYGAAGSTNLEVLRSAIASTPASALPAYLLIAAICVVAGLGFRVTAVPFHFYAPDVFQGTTTPLAAMLAFVPKVAGFVALLRLIGSWLPDPKLAEVSHTVGSQIVVMLWALAILTMFLGNILALLQTNLKRLLAYSSVAHAGYMLVGLAAARSASPAIAGGPAILFYLAIYGAMTVGLFAVLAALDRPGAPVETIDDVAGLCQTHPAMAGVAALFLFSLTGLPPAGGFFGKLLLLQAAWAQDTIAFRVLAVLLAFNAAIAGYYYLRIVAAMYLKPSTRVAVADRSLPAMIGIGICAAVTFGVFAAPNLVWRLVSTASI